MNPDIAESLRAIADEANNAALTQAVDAAVNEITLLREKLALLTDCIEIATANKGDNVSLALRDAMNKVR